MNAVSFFVLNVFLNSFLVFFTTLVLIEIVIFVFRVKRGRVSAVLRMMPIFKLPLDLFLYNFSKWSYLHGVNPSFCEKGSRVFSLGVGTSSSYISFTAPENMTFTIADVIGYLINPRMLVFFSAFVIILSISFLAKKWLSYRLHKKSIDKLMKDSTFFSLEINNSILSQRIKKIKCQIVTSPSFVGSPFVVGLFSFVICVPKNEKLSQKELDAILAHEVEHIRYKDNLVRLILDVIRSLFWWVPTKWLCRRIEEDQEIGSDAGCAKCGIDIMDLSMAICEFAGSVKTGGKMFYYSLTKNAVFGRIELLLQSDSVRFAKTKCFFNCAVTVIVVVEIFLGRFWIF